MFPTESQPKGHMQTFPSNPMSITISKNRGSTLALLLAICTLAAKPFHSGQCVDDFPTDALAKGGSNTVDLVWSGHPVGFSFLTLKDLQIIAYYNQSRQVTLAARNINSLSWTRVSLNSTVGWDSHNSLTMTVDSQGYLHVSGNMHKVSMNYWRSAQPVTTASQFVTGFMQKLSVLVNSANESQATYPSFIVGPKEEFIFSYRNHTGSSSGKWYLLKYDAVAKTFSQATGANPPFSWTGNYSVYPAFTVHGGSVHCLWVWRATGGADQNYRLSYMRSSDLVNWKDAFGRVVTLPVTPSVSLTTIDDVPVQGGLLNGQPKLSFDRDGGPLVAYHKYDASGYSQVYAARPVPTNFTWKIVKLTSNTTWTWEFSGGGSLPPGGSVGNSFGADDPVDGLSTVSVTMTDPNGVSITNAPYLLDETTLTKVIVTYPNTKTYNSANTPASASGFIDPTTLENTYTHNGQSMFISRLRSLGLPYAGLHYYLRWETLPANRDLPRLDGSGNPINPPPSNLRLYRTFCEFGMPTLDGASKVTGVMFKPSTATRVGSMALTTDATRAFGSYLSSPVAGTAHYAEWTFNLDYARDYAVGGATHSLTGSDDSFYVQIDGSPLVDWHVTGRWIYLPVTYGSVKAMTRFTLGAGTHTLRVYAREAGAKLEYLWLNIPSADKSPAASPLSYQGFTLTNDTKAVSGYSLSSPPGSPQTGNTAHYELPVISTGNYLLLGRTRAQNGNSDSFYLSLNGGVNQRWDIPISGTNWTWRAFGGNTNFAAGTLSLDVDGREGGSELDAFMLLRVP
jgi:hypothetical protein